MTEPDPSERDAAPLIEVHRRPNRRALVTALAAAVTAAVTSVAVCLHSPDAVPWYMVPLGTFFSSVVGACLGLGLKPHIMRRLLSYDSSTRTIRARDQWWGRWQTYPHGRFTHLEYSAETGDFHQVRADGRRRRVPVSRGEATREEWQRLVEQFQRDHAPGGRDTA